MHVLAVANVTVYKPIKSDVIIHAENLHIRVKISLNPQLSNKTLSKRNCVAFMIVNISELEKENGELYIVHGNFNITMVCLTFS